MNRRLVQLGVLAAAGLTIGAILAPGRSEADDQPPANGAESPLEYAARFRTNAGLDASGETIKAREADPFATRDKGIPLNDEEFAVVDGLETRVLQSGVEIDAAAKSDPGYAGHWLERSEGFALHVATASDPTVMEAALATAVPKGVDVRIHSVGYSYADLKRAQALVDAELALWQERGVTIMAIGPDVRLNRTVVTILRESNADAGRRIVEAYGPVIAIEWV